MSSVSYNYDIANRLADVDGVPYVYDANGNLLNDGQNTYTYDSANRLTSVLGPSSSSQYAYRCNGESIGQNGCESERVSQTVNGVTTNYVLDSNSALTQVLQDGAKTYLYGLDRISQTNGTGTEYFLTDGLGSVRQLVGSAGNITLAKSYQPYGAEISSGGSGHSNYGFTGEMTDPTGLIYLRARYYASDTGRFISRDTWGGNYNQPLSLNRWNYVEGNPINYTDPTGHCKQGDQACWTKATEIVSEFPTVGINMGFGALFDCDTIIPIFPKYWTTDELHDVQNGLKAIKKAIKNSMPDENEDEVFANAFGNVVITRMSKGYFWSNLKNAAGFTTKDKPNRVVILDLAWELDLILYTTLHEFGHVLNDHGANGSLWDVNEEDFAYSFATFVQLENSDPYNLDFGYLSQDRKDFIVQALTSYK